MRIDRFLQLAEWGCNVPIFIQNPYAHFGRSAWAFLQEHFHKAERLMIIHEKGGKSLVSRGLRLNNAFLTSGTLEMTRKKDVLMAEDVDYEFQGQVTLYKDGIGLLFVEGQFIQKFAMVDFIKEPKLRCIVRDIKKQLFDKFEEDFLVLFGWAKKFTGVNESRLVIYDYRLLRDSA